MWQWLGHYWWIPVGNIVIGILWALTVKGTSRPEKFLMIISGVIGYVAMFIYIVVFYSFEKEINESTWASETSLGELWFN